MHTDFSARLAAGDVMVADGATGTNLQARGLPPETLAEEWVVDEPQNILNLHRTFVEAGSDIILTCSFSGNRLRLRDSKYADRAPEVNRRAVALARQAADEVGNEVFVGGSMGPTGQLMAPLGALTHAEVVQAFAEQAAALAEGGADLLVLETFYALEEVVAAIEGVQLATDIPLICSFSYDREVHTMMGIRPAQMAGAIGVLGVAGLGANCSTTPANMEKIARELVAANTGLPIWVKPNAGIPEGSPPRYTVTPEMMASHTRRYLEAGVQIVGGCCGSTPAHVAAIAETVRAFN